MIPLLSKQNTEGTTTETPQGQVVDRAPGVEGTPVDKELLADAFQFLERLMVEAGATPNGELEGTTNGFQLIEALKTIIANNAPVDSTILFSGVVQVNQSTTNLWQVVKYAGSLASISVSTGGSLQFQLSFPSGTTIPINEYQFFFAPKYDVRNNDGSSGGLFQFNTNFASWCFEKLPNRIDVGIMNTQTAITAQRQEFYFEIRRVANFPTNAPTGNSPGSGGSSGTGGTSGEN